MNSTIQSVPSQKAIFAAYLNMARHNIFIILNHIHDELGLTHLKSDEQIGDSVFWKDLFHDEEGKNIPEKNIKALRLLRKYFPFIPENQNPKLLKAFFKPALKRLNEERNHHTHFYHNETERTSLFGKKQVPEQVTDLSSFLNLAKAFLIKKIGDGIDRQKKANLLAAEGEVVINQLYRELDETDLGILENLKIHLFEENSDQLSELGLAFFTTLFLEKKYASQFLSKLPFLQSVQDEKTGRLYKEWLWAYCCRLPQPKLESSDISMDILNELYRAPKALFYNLSQSDRKRFEVDYHHEDEQLMEALGNQKTILRRKEDRFPDFAMRVMDDLKLFDRLRFQVHLGKWLRKEKASDIIEERKLYENLRSFGRLGYFIPDNAPSDWKRPADQILVVKTEDGDEQTTPWHIDKIEQLRPHYFITGNRIGIKFRRGTNEGEWHSLSEYEPRAENDKKGQIAKANTFQPDSILSTYELGALFFYQYLHKKAKDQDGNALIEEDAESFIGNYQNRFKKFCKDAKEGLVKPVEVADFKKKIRRPHEPVNEKNQYSQEETDILNARTEALQLLLDKPEYRLKAKDLPDALKEYLLGYEPSDLNALKLKLIQRKKETEQLHNQFKKAIDKIVLSGKMIPDELTNENLAEKLTEDIIKWRPVDPNMEPFAERDCQVLLRLLKQYPHNKLALERHINWSKKHQDTMRLIDKRYHSAHPFLDKAGPSNHDNIRDFYLKYLEENEKWLKQISQTAKAKEPKPNLYFRKKLQQHEIEQAIANTKERKEKLSDEVTGLKRKIGQSESILNGELATYLVKDIVFLKPNDKTEGVKNEGNPNSQEYQRLNAKLALYTLDKEGLVLLMNQLGLVDKEALPKPMRILGREAPYPHPFLKNTNPVGRSGIKDFYEVYLLEKIDWLNGLIKNIGDAIFNPEEKGHSAIDAIRFFGDNSFGKTVKDYSSTPVMLPRGLFNEAINMALQKMPSLKIDSTDHFLRCMAKYSKNDTQPFYNWPKLYIAKDLDTTLVLDGDEVARKGQFDKLKKQIASLEEAKSQANHQELPEKDYKELNSLKRLSSTVRLEEQQIRYSQGMDRVLLSMLKLLAVDKKTNEGFSIASEKIKLSTIYPEMRNIKSGKEQPDLPGAVDNLLDELVMMEIRVFDKIIVDWLPIKRHGEFRRFFKDRRIENLIKYYGALQSAATEPSQKVKWNKDMLKYLLLDEFKDDFADPSKLSDIHRKTKQDKVKNFIDEMPGVKEGIFQYLQDKKMDVGIISYLSANWDNLVIHRQQLVIELDDYDTQRDVIFENILNLEKAIHETQNEAFLKKLEESEKPNQGKKPAHVDHYSQLKIIRDEVLGERFSDELLEGLRWFRDKLSHNQLYYSEYLKSKVDSDGKKIVKPVMDHICRTYFWLTSELEKSVSNQNPNT